MPAAGPCRATGPAAARPRGGFEGAGRVGGDADPPHIWIPECPAHPSSDSWLLTPAAISPFRRAAGSGFGLDSAAGRPLSLAPCTPP